MYISCKIIKKLIQNIDLIITIVYNINIIIKSIFCKQKKYIEKIFLSKVKVCNTIYESGHNYIKTNVINKFIIKKSSRKKTKLKIKITKERGKIR